MVTIVAAVAVVAGILDAEELQTLVVLLPSPGNRGEFVTTAAVEGRGGPAFIASASAAPAALPSTVAGTTRRGTLTATVGRRRRAALAATPFTTPFTTPTPAAATASRFTGVTVACFRGACSVATLVSGCVGTAGVDRLGRGPHAIAGGQRLVVKVSVIAGGVADRAVRRRADTDIAFAIATTAAPPAAAAAPSAPSSRTGLGIAVTFCRSFPPRLAVLIACRFGRLVEPLSRLSRTIFPLCRRAVERITVVRGGRPAV
jgi:hypothetical protein